MPVWKTTFFFSKKCVIVEEANKFYQLIKSKKLTKTKKFLTIDTMKQNIFTWMLRFFFCVQTFLKSFGYGKNCYMNAFEWFYFVYKLFKKVLFTEKYQ